MEQKNSETDPYILRHEIYEKGDTAIEKRTIFLKNGDRSFDNYRERFLILISCHMWKLISDHYKSKCERSRNKAFRGKCLHDFGVGKAFLTIQKSLIQEKK